MNSHISPCPAKGIDRLVWHDELDRVVYLMAATDRVTLTEAGAPLGAIEDTLEDETEWLVRRIRGAFEAERLDWQMRDAS